MPYIKQVDRDAIDYRTRLPNTPGELNYAITKLIQQYWDGTHTGPHSYQKINDVLGALDGASKEFYRRVAIPYEDKKIAENGDVYNE